MSRIGIVEEPAPWARHEQPLSPMRDRVTVLEAMGGRKSATPFFVAFAIILLIFIAGAVMLGIGISKAVANRSPDCDITTNNSSVLTTKSSIQTNKASINGDASNEVIKAVPFFLTVTNTKVTGQDLNQTFGDAVRNFYQQIVNVLPSGDPVVDIISIGPSAVTSKMSIFLGDFAPSTLALVGISYTSESSVSKYQIQQALLSDSSLHLGQIEEAGILPTDKDSQLCSSVDPDNPDTDYVPCKKRIVFAIDVSADIDIATFVAQRKFLIDYVFAGNFNHLDRLGLAFFYNRVYGKRFDQLSESGGLEYVRDYIVSQTPKKGPHSLPNLFNDLVNNYDVGGGYTEASYIVFVSKLDTAEVERLVPLARNLTSRGGNLALILLGSNVDPLLENVKKLTNNIILWNNPTKTDAPDNWEYNLWTLGYGCDGGNVPPTVSIPPSPHTLPTDVPTTTLAPSSPQPCAGIFVLGLDTSKSMPDQVFTTQRSFVRNKLFSSDYFNHYERLSLGYYRKRDATVEALRSFDTEKSVQEYVSNIEKSKLNDAILRRFFSAVIDQDFDKDASGSTITVIAFVSSLTEKQANDTRDAVVPLKLKGISIALVGLGGVSEAFMTIVTGDATRVFQWDAMTRSEPNDYQNWFKAVVKCPSSNFNQQLVNQQSMQRSVVVENDENQYPCLNGTIILAYDMSLVLSADNFDIQVRFLVNHIFVKQFNHLERLTLVAYSDYVDSSTFSSQQTIDDVLEHLLDSEQTGQPDLRLLFQTINNWKLQPTKDLVHTIVFVSKIDDKIVNNVIGYVESLQSKNYDITFVLLGALDLTLFKELSPNVIPWNISKENEPFDWKQQFDIAFGCDRPLPLPTISPIGPYPCLGNIIFAFDSSNALSGDNYQKQISFLLNSVFNDQWSNLGRLALIDYNNFASTQSYSTFETVRDVHDFISSSYHSPNSPSLYHAIQSIDINNLVSKTSPSHAIIFVSRITQDIVDNVRNLVEDLQNKQCSITFVALGKTVDTGLLKQLSDQIIQWHIDSMKEPKNWNNLFWTAYGC